MDADSGGDRLTLTGSGCCHTSPRALQAGEVSREWSTNRSPAKSAHWERKPEGQPPGPPPFPARASPESARRFCQPRPDSHRGPGNDPIAIPLVAVRTPRPAPAPVPAAARSTARTLSLAPRCQPGARRVRRAAIAIARALSTIQIVARIAPASTDDADGPLDNLLDAARSPAHTGPTRPHHSAPEFVPHAAHPDSPVSARAGTTDRRAAQPAIPPARVDTKDRKLRDSTSRRPGIPQRP